MHILCDHQPPVRIDPAASSSIAAARNNGIAHRRAADRSSTRAPPSDLVRFRLPVIDGALAWITRNTLRWVGVGFLPLTVTSANVASVC